MLIPSRRGFFQNSLIVNQHSLKILMDKRPPPLECLTEQLTVISGWERVGYITEHARRVELSSQGGRMRECWGWQDIALSMLGQLDSHLRMGEGILGLARLITEHARRVGWTSQNDRGRECWHWRSKFLGMLGELGNHLRMSGGRGEMLGLARYVPEHVRRIGLSSQDVWGRETCWDWPESPPAANHPQGGWFSDYSYSLTYILGT